MLTEPLTLPPRRWQQLALAAVVGALFVPYNLGFVANSPELALLAGNAVAFAVGQRGGVRLAFVASRPTHAHDDGIQLPPGTSGALCSRTGPGAPPAPGHGRRRSRRQGRWEG